MKTSKVKKMRVDNRFFYWIQEREDVRKSKDWLRSKPWTDDEILQNYRFCNVRRMDDKVSRWLLDNWYKPYFDHPFILPAVALARFINKPESLKRVTVTVFRDKWFPQTIVRELRKFRDEGNTVFNGAYMVRGNDGIDKIDCVVNHYVSHLFKNGKPLNLDCSWMEYSHSLIKAQYGFGSFMAGQIIADLRWATSGSWSDKKYWAPVGPGSSRGAARLFDEKPYNSMKQEEFDGRLEWVIDESKNRLPKSLTNRLEAIDYQNCLCEFDKYERVLWGEGRPKSKYPGAK